MSTCICTKGCDCQSPPSAEDAKGVFHVSEGCPVHNVFPAPDRECPIHGGMGRVEFSSVRQ